MSKITTPTGEVELVNARRTESLDAPYIKTLIRAETDNLFGSVNVVDIIERALLAVTLSNQDGEVIAHAAFLDYPNHNVVDPAAWEPWMRSCYEIGSSNSLNSFFMHFFVAKDGYEASAASEIIRTVFNAVPDLHFIYLIAKSLIYPEPALEKLFSACDEKEGNNLMRNCSVFQCLRRKHVPILHIRPAQVEDHDDLTPIFNKQSEILRQTYGDFFLAELIASQDEGMRCFAAESKGKAIGFVSVTNEINTDMLNQCFELGVFHGLRKPHPDDVLAPPREPTPRLPSPPADKPAEAPPPAVEKLPEVADETAEVVVSPKLSGSVAGSAKSSVVMEPEDDEGLEIPDDEDTGFMESPLASPKSYSPLVPPNTSYERPIRSFIPTYHGESNALVIQLFAIDEKYDMRSIDFLPHIFDAFSDKDFVIITLPTMVPEFPLLNSFVRVSPRPESTLSQELYVFHRAGLHCNFNVRAATANDVPAVEKLVNNLRLKKSLISDLKLFNTAGRDATGTQLQAFLCFCFDQVVGIGILRKEEGIEYIRSHYNVEDFIYFNHHRRDEHARIHHLAMNPIFNHFTKLFIKEMMRLGHKTCFYYPVYPKYASDDLQDAYSLPTALNDMVPVRARRQISYPLEKLGQNAPSKRVLAKEEAYALNHINRKLIFEPKVTVNARIVVVGASTTGISFLETLAFCPHLRFNNLILVSPHGFPGDYQSDKIRDRSYSSNLIYSHDQYATMSLRSWVNSVHGKMTGINRKKKFITVNQSVKVPYDYLMLATGLQYLPVLPLEADTKPSSLQSLKKKRPHQPKNCFCINDFYDVEVALYWLQNFLKIKRPGGQLVVYGDSLDALTFIQAMLDSGVPPKTIVYIVQPNSTRCFENDEIQSRTLQSLMQAGVNCHKNYKLLQWNNGEKDPRTLSLLTFVNPVNEDELNIDCSALFPFCNVGVDFDTFQAINDACIVFDGRLVVDANFHTNDVTIRGAGPLTKFQRVYHVEKWTHANFNSHSVGEKLAHAMLRLFDPTLEQDLAPPAEPVKMIPQFNKSPKMIGAYLPGGNHYLHVSSPLAQDYLHPTVGDEGTWLKTEAGNSLFLIHLDIYQKIDILTCFSDKPFKTSNLLCLYGLHQRILNNLVARYKEGLIKDFFEFFDETWALAFYHDRFRDLCDELREILATRPSEDRLSLEEHVRKMMEDEIGLSNTQKDELKKEFTKSGCKRALDTRFLRFLGYNYYHLPMYARPEMV